LNANKNLNYPNKNQTDLSFQDFCANIKNLSFLKEGWRGKIFVGFFNEKKVAIKVAKSLFISYRI